jgi:RNA polymerase sigma-70 factor (ECF subfamily)
MMQPNFGSDFASEFDSEYETDLLNRLKRGDQTAWSEFVKFYGARLHRYLTPHLPDPESTDDVLSEIMLASVKAIQTVDGKSSLTTLIYAIAQRKLTDFWRRRQSPQALESSNLPEVESLQESSQNRVEFSEVMSRLGEVERRVLMLRYQEGLSISEIAETMGYSFKAVESLLSRARQHLKEVLTQMEIASSTSPAELTTLLNTVVQMLDTQVKRCLAYGMQREAMLFAQSAQLLIELASKTIGETALDGRRKNAKA